MESKSLGSETDLFRYYTPKNPKKLINPKKGLLYPCHFFCRCEIDKCSTKTILSKYITRFYIRLPLIIHLLFLKYLIPQNVMQETRIDANGAVRGPEVWGCGTYCLTLLGKFAICISTINFWTCFGLKHYGIILWFYIKQVAFRHVFIFLYK